MAYLEGETLARRVSKGPLEIRVAIDIAIQIANGLGAAHDLGIVHRDIKSAKVIAGADGHVSILDFGLALRAGVTRLTGTGGTMGNPAYMSPEQAQDLPLDGLIDMWSLVGVLFDMPTA